MSIYDRFEPKKVGDFPEFFKFHTPGTTISGELFNVRTHTFDRDEEETIILDVRTDQGSEHSIVCGSVGLHNKVMEVQPKVGDRITVTRGPNSGRAHTWALSVDGASSSGGGTSAPAPEPVQPMA